MTSFKTKKEPGVSNRDIISGLTDGGAYMSEARSWSNTPLHAADSEEDMAAVFASGAKGRSLVIGELMSGGLICYQRKKCVPHCPFQKNNQHLGSGAST